jgi:hypothetical protein
MTRADALTDQVPFEAAFCNAGYRGGTPNRACSPRTVTVCLGAGSSGRAWDDSVGLCLHALKGERGEGGEGDMRRFLVMGCQGICN